MTKGSSTYDPRWLDGSDDVLEEDEATVRMYTPALMAEMLGISVRAIRLWHRSGLLQPSKVVMKIPYFDYGSLASARTFANWLKQGISAQSIAQQLSSLSRLLGTDPAELPDELSISLEGKRLVLSREKIHLDASGQFQLGFDSTPDLDENLPATIKLGTSISGPFVPPMADPHLSEISDDRRLLGKLDAATQAEDDEDFDAAACLYREILTEFGPNPEVCFQLAEVLYRQSDISGARERYFMTLELDPTLVEARANLGCVLIECGQLDQAIAAFKQALDQFPDYADVHFHLARVLEMHGQAGEAIEHWKAFLRLAPASPWADEATARLAEAT